MLELVSFFGNPGPEYKGNRHNAGWHLAQKLPFYDQLVWRKKFKGLWADMEGQRLLPFCPDEAAAPPSAADRSIAKIHFLMPGTYMNLSGDSVFAAATFFKIKPEQIIVIHDELELPLGTISLKFDGGLGGHNGLRSMKGSFGTADFWRLRIGIGRPDDRLPGQGGPQGSGKGIIDWVLSDFSADECAVLEPVLEAGADLLLKTIICGPEDFLPYWSKKKIG
ncbi:MAG: aminoacyl-tRNA hydrolase [Treponema sp.]|jgi:PTH1 family peptidyl-tRNA hydrolase|nr:aminoacyl-tRNA hydrolase [Treponema sp.]